MNLKEIEQSLKQAVKAAGKKDIMLGRDKEKYYFTNGYFLIEFNSVQVFDIFRQLYAKKWLIPELTEGEMWRSGNKQSGFYKYERDIESIKKVIPTSGDRITPTSLIFENTKEQVRLFKSGGYIEYVAEEYYKIVKDFLEFKQGRKGYPLVAIADSMKIVIMPINLTSENKEELKEVAELLIASEKKASEIS